MKTNRIIIIGATLILSFVMLITPVLAGGGHFIKAEASGPDNAGNLTLSFLMSALGKRTWINVNGFATRDAIYACKPVGQDFLSDTTYVSVTDYAYPNVYLTVEKGKAEGVLPLSPPWTSLSCDEGMEVALAMITYSDVNVSAVIGIDLNGWPVITNKEIPGTFSATYYGFTP